MATETETKFYRTQITFEVLSDEPVSSGLSLGGVLYECNEGGWSGQTTSWHSEEVSRELMADLLIAQGSDPEFLLGEEDDDEPE
jgi:hypothetical protein